MEALLKAAKQLGQSARTDKRVRVPAFDTVLTRLVLGLRPDDEAQALQAWLDGWDDQNCNTDEDL